MIKKKPSQLQSLQTEHHAAVDEIEKYKVLVDSVQDYAIFLLDTTGHILTWNKGAKKNKGYSADEIIGKHFSIFYTADDIDAKKPEKELEIALKFGRAEDEDWRVRKDGSRFWASVVITCLYDSDNNHIGFAKVTRDLTDRKMQEDELRQANHLLKLQQQELTKLNQAKDDFISLASHQLRTPATATKQLLGLFTEGFIKDIESNNLEIIEKAYSSNERLIDIVNNLLKVAQVDSGKMKLEIEPCNVTELVASVIEEFKSSFNKRTQTVVFHNKNKINIILADPKNLRMALENIISNATKYTRTSGSITVAITQKKNELIISISDNGVGIAEQDLKSLFKKFHRIPNDLSNEVGGTGLGLYWADKIIQLHGGKIEISSVLNEGSTFNIHLPIGV